MLHFVTVNWGAVVVAALVQIAVGGVWNGVIFAQAFFDSHEVRERVVPNFWQAVTMVVLTIFNSFVLFTLFHNLGVDTAVAGMKLSFWLWGALLLPFIVGTGFATGRKKSITLELGHTLLAMLAAGLVLGIWH